MGKNEIVQHRANAVAPAGFGSKVDVQAIRDRIVAMMPGAAGAPSDVVWAAAQLAVAHRLNPFNGEIYIMPTGRKQDANGQWVDDWRAHVGVKGLRKKAREQAEFMTEFRDLTQDELKAYRRGDYDPQDVGVECTLYRLDVAQSAQRAGLPYIPFRAVGFWRVKGVYSNKTKSWSEDNVPNTWTAQQVAKKRAEINAIKEAFDLTVDVADPSRTGEDATFEVLEQQIQQEDRDAAPMAQPYAMDDDGLLVGRQPVQSSPVPQDVEFYTPAQPADDKATVLAAWGSASNKAKAWAVDHGHCENATLAGEIWRNVAAERFSNKLTAQNLGEMMSAFYDEVTKEVAA